jgi:D-alanyl-lipoteichoic acid acyltransferase DltB (MBOAT superfamily)
MTYRNLMLTMVLGGLWHGAAWNFVVWGVFHGLILCIWRRLGDRPAALRDGRSTRSIWLDFVWTLSFFHVTCFGWLLFFVKDLHDVLTLVVNCLGNWRWNGLVGAATLLVFALPVVTLELLAERDERRGKSTHWPLLCRIALYSFTLTAILLCGSIDANEFIYFQF